jgi:hypothetical protein
VASPEGTAENSPGVFGLSPTLIVGCPILRALCEGWDEQNVRGTGPRLRAVVSHPSQRARRMGHPTIGSSGSGSGSRRNFTGNPKCTPRTCHLGYSQPCPDTKPSSFAFRRVNPNGWSFAPSFSAHVPRCVEWVSISRDLRLFPGSLHTLESPPDVHLSTRSQVSRVCLAVAFVCALRHAPPRHKQQEYVNDLHR